MKIGIYGGSFSPPHMGHIRAAKEFIEEMQLDKLLVIPAYIPPNKADMKMPSSEIRMELCRLAFSVEKCFVSDMEMKRGGISYTAQTLLELKQMHPDDELFWLCGADKLQSLDKWYKVEEIFRLCTVVCVSREKDYALSRLIDEKISLLREQFGARIRHISVKVTELSSSRIRDMIKNNEDISGLVLPSVAAYIKAGHLYE